MIFEEINDKIRIAEGLMDGGNPCEVMNKRRILIAPLDWGLGHSSRCIPIVYELLKQGMEVVLAGDGASLLLLKKEFPQLESLDLPNFKIRYPGSIRIALCLAFQVPSMLLHLRKEGKMLAEMSEKMELDAVISDNRYGLAITGLPSVIISHQLHVQAGIFSPLLNKLIHKYLRRFDHCWIPDYEGAETIAGKLSSDSASVPRSTYIGPLSRFQEIKEGEKQFRVAAILSGPEPLRSRFEKEIVNQLKSIEGRHILVRGKNDLTFGSNEQHSNIEVAHLLDSQEVEKVIDNSSFILARSGYSTIMDLIAKKRSALIVPTPGQTEQEYLAKFHRTKGRFVVQNQGDLNIGQGIDDLLKLSAAHFPEMNGKMAAVVEDFCASLY